MKNSVSSQSSKTGTGSTHTVTAATACMFECRGERKYIFIDESAVDVFERVKERFACLERDSVEQVCLYYDEPVAAYRGNQPLQLTYQERFEFPGILRIMEQSISDERPFRCFIVSTVDCAPPTTISTDSILLCLQPPSRRHPSDSKMSKSGSGTSRGTRHSRQNSHAKANPGFSAIHSPTSNTNRPLQSPLAREAGAIISPRSRKYWQVNFDSVGRETLLQLGAGHAGEIDGSYVAGSRSRSSSSSKDSAHSQTSQGSTKNVNDDFVLPEIPKVPTVELPVAGKSSPTTPSKHDQQYRNRRAIVPIVRTTTLTPANSDLIDPPRETRARNGSHSHGGSFSRLSRTFPYESTKSTSSADSTESAGDRWGKFLDKQKHAEAESRVLISLSRSFRKTKVKDHCLPITVFLCGILLSYFIYDQATSYELAKLDEEFHSIYTEYTAGLTRELNLATSDLNSLGTYLSASTYSGNPLMKEVVPPEQGRYEQAVPSEQGFPGNDQVVASEDGQDGEITPNPDRLTKAYFETLADDLITKRSVFQVIEWVPKVQHSERLYYERAASNRCVCNASIHEFTSEDTTIDTDVYYPVYYVHPPFERKSEQNELLLSDYRSESRRFMALQRAEKSNGTLLTNPMELPERNGKVGVLAMCPVQGREFLGFAVGVIDVQSLFQTSLSTQKGRPVVLFLFGAELAQSKAASQYSLTYAITWNSTDERWEEVTLDNSERWLGMRKTALKFSDDVLVKERSLNEAGQDWILVVASQDELIASQTTNRALSYTIVCLVVAIFIVVGFELATLFLKRARLEKQVRVKFVEQSEQAKQSLLVNCFHEARGPFRNIERAINDLVRSKDNLTEQQLSTLTYLDQYSKSYSNILDNVIQSQAFAEGNVKHRQQDRFFCQEIERSVLNSFRHRTKSERIRLEVHCDAHLQDMELWGDKGRIKQCLDNLLSNSIKYTNPGGRISVHIEQVQSVDHLKHIKHFPIPANPEMDNSIDTNLPPNLNTPSNQLIPRRTNNSVSRTLTQISRSRTRNVRTYSTSSTQTAVEMSECNFKFTDPPEPKPKRVIPKRLPSLNVDFQINSDPIEFHPDVIIVRFGVTDTGTGMHKGDQDKLFKPYSKIIRPGETNTGLGLGLSLTKQIVQLMHGHLGVTSSQYYGSEFWFAVPFKRVTESDYAPPTPRFEDQKEIYKESLEVGTEPGQINPATNMHVSSGNRECRNCKTTFHGPQDCCDSCTKEAGLIEFDEKPEQPTKLMPMFRT